MKLKIILIGVIIGVITLSGLFLINNQVIEISATIPFANSYTYDTICDVDDIKKFMIEEVWTTTMQITGGFHNDNVKVIDFFKSNNLLVKLEMTPQELFKKVETTNTLGANVDPILFDVMFWMPLTLDVIGSSPEFIETFSIDEFSSQIEYENQLLFEMNKCN